MSRIKSYNGKTYIEWTSEIVSLKEQYRRMSVEERKSATGANIKHKIIEAKNALEEMAKSVEHSSNQKTENKWFLQ